MQISKAQLSSVSPYRLTLTPDSKVIAAAPFTDWRALVQWSAQEWLARLLAHGPDPLELPVELSCEALLDDWSLDGQFAASGVPGRENSEREVRVRAQGCVYQLRIDAGENALEQRLLAASGNTPLLANVHIEFGRQVLSPLALLGEAPDYLTLDNKNMGKAALVRALNIR